MPKIRISRVQCQIYLSIAEPKPIFSKDTNKPSAKANLFAFCRAGVFSAKPKYEKSRAEASVSLIMPRRSIFGEARDRARREQFFGPQPAGHVRRQKTPAAQANEKPAAPRSGRPEHIPTQQRQNNCFSISVRLTSICCIWLPSLKLMTIPSLPASRSRIMSVLNET